MHPRTHGDLDKPLGGLGIVGVIGAAPHADGVLLAELEEERLLRATSLAVR